MKKLSIVLILLLALVLSSCGKKVETTEETATKYSVDYCGSRECYTGAKGSYLPGKEVKIYYDYKMISTDTNYTFYLDDKPLSAIYEDGKGFLIEFTMPDHDVKLEVKTDNSMEALSTEEASTEAPEGVDSPVTDGSDPVTVAYASDVKEKPANTVSVNLATGDTSQSLVFEASREVKNVQFMKLTIFDVDLDGNAKFQYSIAHEEDAISPDKALQVDVTFWGDMPEYGIAYSDPATGETKYFVVIVSGKDGSVSLDPIKKDYLSTTIPDDYNNPNGPSPSSTGADAAISCYQDIIYMYKEAQTNGSIDYTLWESLNMYTCLEGYGWPQRDSNDEVTYSIYDINKDGTPELIISFYGYIADIYSYNGTKAVEALTRSYRDSITIYDDGLVKLESTDAATASISWYELNPTIGEFLPTVEDLITLNDDGTVKEEAYYRFAADGAWDEIEQAYKQSGILPVWAYEWGGDITYDEFYSRASSGSIVKDFPEGGLIMEFNGF